MPARPPVPVVGTGRGTLRRVVRCGGLAFVASAALRSFAAALPMGLSRFVCALARDPAGASGSTMIDGTPFGAGDCRGWVRAGAATRTSATVRRVTRIETSVLALTIAKGLLLFGRAIEAGSDCLLLS